MSDSTIGYTGIRNYNPFSSNQTGAAGTAYGTNGTGSGAANNECGNSADGGSHIYSNFSVNSNGADSSKAADRKRRCTMMCQH